MNASSVPAIGRNEGGWRLRRGSAGFQLKNQVQLKIFELNTPGFCSQYSFRARSPKSRATAQESPRDRTGCDPGFD